MNVLKAPGKLTSCNLIRLSRGKCFFFIKNSVWFKMFCLPVKTSCLPSENGNETTPLYIRQALTYTSPSAEHCPFEEQLCCSHFKTLQESPLQWLSQRHWPITHCPRPLQSLDTQSGSWAHTIVDTSLEHVNSPLKMTRENSHKRIISNTVCIFLGSIFNLLLPSLDRLFCQFSRWMVCSTHNFMKSLAFAYKYALSLKKEPLLGWTSSYRPLEEITASLHSKCSIQEVVMI